ncbi:MAG: C1 family peptidase, partial [Candidatus Hodarchaeota archaeon]
MLRKAEILRFSRCGIFDNGIAIPQRVGFKRRFSTSSLGLIISGFCLALLVQSAFAQPFTPPQLNAAPINPEFINWQYRAATFGIKMYDEEGHAFGHIPAPFDWSHLQFQTATTHLLEETLPSSYDLRTEGYVTSVKDQGDCGSCWSFATYGSLESWLLKNDGATWDFSENHLKNYHGFDFAPCEGGNTYMSTAYLARWSGPVDESNDPYHDWDDRPSPGGPTQKYLKSTLWFFSESDIKNALMTYGAMFVSMRYESASYNPAEYTYYYSGSDEMNHAVTIVGWDDDKTVSGAPGNGAWLVKNSWSSDWGDGGYFWISYYDTKAIQYAVAFFNAVSTSSYVANYQYDPLGWTNSAGYGTSIAWAANVFTATADEDLTAVAIYAVDSTV